LDVYKPGKPGHRLAGWVENGIVYVAELYARHDEYTSNLPGHYRKNYSPQEFKPYMPQVIELGLDEEEAEGDEMIAIAIHDRKQAEADRDEALEMAAQIEKELEETKRALDESRKEADTLGQRVRQLEAEQQTLRRRLRWALLTLGRSHRKVKMLMRRFRTVRKFTRWTGPE